MRIARAQARIAAWGNKRLALLISSAILGLPPMFLTCLAGGALAIPFRAILVVGLAGRTVRFVAIALIAALY